MYRIYIIEDDSIIAGKIKEHMTNWGFEARCASDFRIIKDNEAEQAVRIEQVCFPPNEACSEKNMIERIKNAPELFL